ncbi:MULTISPECIES: hypothetical protein [unclassified Streptomyces]|uniref:hypothetical protein n=1 Tax=unclassified Streptomyces TaxID=2593676 RepID=UPI00037B9CCD|nr:MULTISPECIES: hypothetical protein [unclassified Streptomyces]MYT32302.1 hypothetical protein [Streptomyces sp. SID8354]
MIGESTALSIQDAAAGQLSEGTVNHFQHGALWACEKQNRAFQARQAASDFGTDGVQVATEQGDHDSGAVMYNLFQQAEVERVSSASRTRTAL